MQKNSEIRTLRQNRTAHPLRKGRDRGGRGEQAQPHSPSTRYAAGTGVHHTRMHTEKGRSEAASLPGFSLGLGIVPTEVESTEGSTEPEMALGWQHCGTRIRFGSEKERNERLLEVSVSQGHAHKTWCLPNSCPYMACTALVHRASFEPLTNPMKRGQTFYPPVTDEKKASHVRQPGLTSLLPRLYVGI